MVPEPLNPDRATPHGATPDRAPDPGAPAPRTLPRIPGYRLEGILGRGATGVVYRARQLSVDRPVALKVLNSDPSVLGSGTPGASGTRAARRLQREARTAARLAHPNIISAIDMGEEGGTWWYAMELVEGESLAERLERGPLPERIALRLFIPLCEALVHLSENGVVHRDIKPGNILVDGRGRARLVDLGLAFHDEDPLLTQGGGTLGTPHYISPEQARDPATADRQSDIWSFGATLFHALTGRPPFQGRSVAEILSSVLYAKIPDPHALVPSLSRGLALVLRKCLQRDKALRYPDPAELLADLERIRERRMPAVERSSLEPVAKRSSPLAWPLAAVGIGLAIAIALWIAKPWSGVESGGAASADAAAWAPLEELAQRAREDPSRLAESFEDLLALRSAEVLPPGALARHQAVYDELYAELERELWHLRREVDDEVQARLAERDFAGADRERTRGVRERLASRTGYTPETLPGRWKPAFDAWTAGLADSVGGAREAALASFGAALARYYDGEVRPRFDALRAAKRWKDARAVLGEDPSAWIAAAGADDRGLAAASVAEVLAVRARDMAERRDALDREWRELDNGLRRWVQDRSQALEKDLEARAVLHAGDILAEEWSRELLRAGLAEDQMPEGQLHLAREAFEDAVARLERVGRDLRLADARQGLLEIEQELAPLWSARRYDLVREAWREHLDDPWLEPLRDTIAVREREAALLDEVLQRAGRSLVRRAGTPIDVRVGASVYSGRLDVGLDPVAKGFDLVPSGGRTLSFALRPSSEAPAGAIVLGGDALEALAFAPSGDAAAAPGEPGAMGGDDALARASLRLREGDPRGAQRALREEPPAPGDPLAEDLRRRIADASSEQRTVEVERRTAAVTKLNLLRRERLHGDLAKTRRRVDDLRKGYGDVLLPAEVLELEEIQAALDGPAPGTAEDFRAAFGPNDGLDLSGFGRVRLGFRFDQSRVGAWDPGSWWPDGRGWSAAASPRSDADLVDRPGPSLALGPPLDVSGVLSVELEIEEPADERPEMLLVSAAGFHAVFAGARDGGEPRCLIDSGDLAAVVARARAGEGKPFAGLAGPGVHAIALRTNPSRGTASVEVDGVAVADTHALSPRASAGGASLTVRAWETVRLLAVRIEAGRR